MPFLSVFRKRKPPPVQLAALLAAELQKVILAEEDKTALLAKVIECQHHEVQHHPRFATAIEMYQMAASMERVLKEIMLAIQQYQNNTMRCEVCIE